MEKTQPPPRIAIEAEAKQALRPLKGHSVAIVGFSPSTRGQAPWEDEADWPELWICNRLPLQEGVTRWTRHFDPHPISWTETHFDAKLWSEYHDGFLTVEQGDRLIYLAEASPKFPNSVAYPHEHVVRFLGRRYVTSAIGYQVALALMLGAKRIGLWGIDLRADEEYFGQRSNVEWLLGIAQGMGVEVVLPPQSAVLNADRSQPLYGIEEGSEDLIEAERAIVKRIEELNKVFEGLKADNELTVSRMQITEGARQEANHLLQRIRLKRRGGVF